MKRFTAVILLLVYSVASTGSTIHYHYCMGEMANFSLWGGNEKTCGNCGMEMEEGSDTGCCKDEQHWIKIEDDQKSTITQFEILKWQSESKGLIVLLDIQSVTENLSPIAKAKTPLRSCQAPTYLRNCVFRI